MKKNTNQNNEATTCHSLFIDLKMKHTYNDAHIYIIVFFDAFVLLNGIMTAIQEQYHRNHRTKTDVELWHSINTNNKNKGITDRKHPEKHIIEYPDIVYHDLLDGTQSEFYEGLNNHLTYEKQTDILEKELDQQDDGIVFQMNRDINCIRQTFVFFKEQILDALQEDKYLPKIENSQNGRPNLYKLKELGTDNHRSILLLEKEAIHQCEIHSNEIKIN